MTSKCIINIALRHGCRACGFEFQINEDLLQFFFLIFVIGGILIKGPGSPRQPPAGYANDFETRSLPY